MRETKTLTELYDQLRPDERMRMYLEAGARADRTERRRLIDTCPRKNYRCVDAAFGNAMDAASLVALAMLIELMMDIRLVEATTRIREMEMPEWALNGSVEDLAPEQVEIMELVADGVWCLFRIKAMWAAWEYFCRRTWNLDGLAVVRAHAGMTANRIPPMLQLCEDVILIERIRDQWLAMFEWGWKRQLAINAPT